MDTKRFSLRTVLTVTTGRFLCEPKPGQSGNGIEQLCELLAWMTNDTPFTHQLPRFGRECTPWLLRWFPELEAVNGQLDKLDGILKERDSKEACNLWMTYVRLVFPDLKEVYDVPRIPADDHARINPITEAVAKMGNPDKVAPHA